MIIKILHTIHKNSNEPSRSGRKNVKLVPSAGKYATGAKRGKRCNRCQARENMQPLERAVKSPCKLKFAFDIFAFTSDWLRKSYSVLIR